MGAWRYGILVALKPTLAFLLFLCCFGLCWYSFYDVTSHQMKYLPSKLKLLGLKDFTLGNVFPEVRGQTHPAAQCLPLAGFQSVANSACGFV